MVVQEGGAGEIILISLVFRSFQRPILSASGSDNCTFPKVHEANGFPKIIAAFPAFEDRVDEN